MFIAFSKVCEIPIFSDFRFSGPPSDFKPLTQSFEFDVLLLGISRPLR